MPRPFPFPLNVGTDICSIHRIHFILSHPSKLNQGFKFLNKIFTEEEKAQLVGGSNGGLQGPLVRWQQCLLKRRGLDVKKQELGLSKRRTTKKDSKSLDKPEPWTHGPLGTDSNAIFTSLSEQLLEEERIVRDQLKHMAPFVAGRFAAKEAAIKAHRSRRLTFHDINIVKLKDVDGLTQAPIALIKKENADEQEAWEDAQIARINISHDGAYATAVCMAFEADQEVLGPTPNGASAQTSFTSGEQEREQTKHDEIAARAESSASRPLESEFSRTAKARARDAAVYVGNIHEHATDEDLVRAFEGLSSITKAYICRASGGKSLGYGFVVLANARDAEKAIQLKDGSLLMGEHIRCGRANSRVDRILETFGEADNRVLREDLYELDPTSEKVPDEDANFGPRPEARMAWEISKGFHTRLVRSLDHKPVRLVKQDEQTFWTNVEDLLRDAEVFGEV